MPALKPDQLDDQIRSGKLGSVYLFDGPELFLKQRTTQKIINRLLPAEQRDFNLDRFDGNDHTAADIVNACQSVPFLAERRVVVVNNADELAAADRRAVAEQFARLPSSTCAVFLYEGKADMREELPAHAASHGHIVTFWPPFENQLPNWVIGEARSHGKKMTLEAAKALADACADLTEIINEVEKLALFCGKKPVIDLDDVVAHGMPGSVGDYRDFEEALWRRDLSGAMEQGQLLCDMGIGAEAIFPVFERVFRTLLMARYYTKIKGWSANDVHAALNIRGKIQQAKLMEGLRLYTNKDLEKSLERVAGADYDVKTGALPGRMAVSLLAASLLRRETRN